MLKRTYNGLFSSYSWLLESNLRQTRTYVARQSDSLIAMKLSFITEICFKAPDIYKGEEKETMLTTLMFQLCATLCAMP
jgi:hypothetical protein